MDKFLIDEQHHPGVNSHLVLDQTQTKSRGEKKKKSNFEPWFVYQNQTLNPFENTHRILNIKHMYELSLTQHYNSPVFRKWRDDYRSWGQKL